MNMIEKVAKAIITARFPLVGWDNSERWIQKDAMYEAEMAIKAMREPTEEMFAGLTENGNWKDSRMLKAEQFMDPADAFRGLIDEALKDQP